MVALSVCVVCASTYLFCLWLLCGQEAEKFRMRAMNIVTRLDALLYCTHAHNELCVFVCLCASYVCVCIHT
jgi:hypothetical protein